MINRISRELKWEEKTLKQIGNNIYTNNASRMRTKKVTTNEATTYELSRTNIISMKKITKYKNITIDFVYDTREILIGLNTIEGNYFYIWGKIYREKNKLNI